MRRKHLIIVIATTLLVAACGSDDKDVASTASTGGGATTTATAATTSPTTTASSETAATTAPSESDTTTAITEAASATDAPTTAAPTTAAQENVDPDGVLHLAISLTNGWSHTYDPAASTSVCDSAILVSIYDTLVHKDVNSGELSPGLAESWKVVDKSTIEFTLRTGLKFQDGQSLDAAALKSGLEHNMSGKGAAGTTLAAVITSVDQVDDRTVRIATKTPVAASLPIIFAGREGMIIAPGTEATAATQPVGAGPFQFDSEVSGQKISIRRFDGFWNADQIQLGGVDFLHTEGGPPQVNGMLAGDFDVEEITPDLIPGLEGQPGVEIVKQSGSRTYAKLAFNLGQAPFDNKDFRQAVNYAVDRAAILKVAFANAGDVAWSPYPSEFAAFNPSADGQYEYDVDKAKAALAKSGLTDVSFTALVPAFPAFQQAGQIVQQNLADIGVTMNLEVTTNPVQDYFIDKKTPAFVTIASAGTDPVDTLRGQFTPGNLRNPGEYSNDALNKLIADASAEPDEGKRNDMLKQAVGIVVDEALDVPFVFQTKLRAVNTDRITGEVIANESCQGVDLTRLAVKAS
jgi:ABC-type transport system substrate-binding protein